MRKRIWQGIALRRAGVMTVVVEVQREWQRRPYDKKIKRTKRFMVHDPNDAAKVGGRVEFRECRPISKRKRWIIVEPKIENRK
ncbi:MAG: 30S ribosomal protein S17 [Candidatus Andersenbacteria bacterium RIFCSPHIGHO2_12_FULL_46_9]|nr:MAG: 30S ribosomal protein S17 [Candidatus Andersenbacteria bacterium RIFCSPHIGHO2_02_FULL_46_16]OGY36865.1 MAG: 30S ribosomal protein S17 [Candidatus Andersenbacteria bacterium RIFCSPLOWO2_02_FULL_46_11]OGY38475.1 MAG: 30S ribosomal protein S17 [Candidatus Andersenbacteria bacterium RIFCSPHIGHO2_12_FULL_46_9]OGY41665.1 MAG: 30S ribosomal protein S17 [Candidatus Andersenbacteria bacterium RIFCSPLOWO2_12_FULL_45_8]